MPFDDWQLDKLRTAMRAHRAYTPGRSGPGLTWLELAADIEVYANVSMSPEVLRQFVEGVSKREYPVRFRVPSPENLEAIVAYLTHADIDALAADELDQERFAWQVPLRVIEFLKQDFDIEAAAVPESLEGTFRATLTTDDTITVVQLALRPDPHNGFIRVAETADIYTDPGGSAFLTWTDKDRRNRHQARTDAEGWAVLTPEDNLLFFLKDRPYGRNHYWTLAADAELWSGAPVQHLILLRHDYPAEPEESEAGPGVPQSVSRHLIGNISCFERI